MLTLLFIICFFAVFGKLLMFGIKADNTRYHDYFIIASGYSDRIGCGRSDLSGIPDSNRCGNCRIAAVMQ